MDIRRKRRRERGYREPVRVERHERSQLPTGIVRRRARAGGVFHLGEPIPVQLARAAEGHVAEENAGARLGIRRIEVNRAPGPAVAKAERAPVPYSCFVAAPRLAVEEALVLLHRHLPKRIARAHQLSEYRT